MLGLQNTKGLHIGNYRSGLFKLHIKPGANKRWKFEGKIRNSGVGQGKHNTKSSKL